MAVYDTVTGSLKSVGTLAGNSTIIGVVET